MGRPKKKAAEPVNGNTVLQNTYPVAVTVCGGGVSKESHKVRRVVLSREEFDAVVHGKLKSALVDAGFDWVDRTEDGFPYNQYHEGSELQFHLLIKCKKNKSSEEPVSPGQMSITDAPDEPEEDDEE